MFCPEPKDIGSYSRHTSRGGGILILQDGPFVLHLVTVVKGLSIHRAFAHGTNLVVDNNGSQRELFFYIKILFTMYRKEKEKTPDVFGRGLLGRISEI
jgi:hypothetical protein